MKPDVLVVVGTDHHPFRRLVEWMDDFSRERDVTVLVQHGSAPPPTDADGARLLPHDQLGDLFRGALAIVCHGGPATIADARSAGHKPVCVPRNPEHGEHVDEHQMLFAARMAERGEVDLPLDKDELFTVLDAILADPTRNAVDPEAGGQQVAAAVAAFGDIADDAAVQSRQRRRRALFGS